MKFIKSLRRYEFLLFNLTIFVNFLDFLPFTCYKNTNDTSIYKIILADFRLGIILNKLFKNCNKLY